MAKCKDTKRVTRGIIGTISNHEDNVKENINKKLTYISIGNLHSFKTHVKAIVLLMKPFDVPCSRFCCPSLL